MFGKRELRRAFEHKEFVTKGYVKEQMGYVKYDDVRKFFDGLQHIGQRYLTEDVIEKILEYVEYPN